MKELTPLLIKQYLTAGKEMAEDRIAKWQETLTKNPVYAMEWSDQVFNDAAKIEMASTTLNLVAYGESRAEIDDDAIVAEVRKHTQRELLRLATQNTNRSTGQGKNMMDYARVNEWATFSEWLNGRY